jgi:transcriptional antiterminator
MEANDKLSESELQKMKEEEWYYGRLFELYIEEGCSIKNLSLRTTIPMANVSRDIKKVRIKLNEIRKKYYDGP